MYLDIKQIVQLSLIFLSKHTNSHQYLPYDSYYFAEHIKRPLVFSQTLRLKRICYQKSDTDSHAKELTN